MTDRPALADQALDTILRTARSHNGFTPDSVPEALIRAVYDLAKMGPTSANCSPARFVWVGTPEGKARLLPLMSEGNRAKTASAPWTVIVAWDETFYDQVPRLFPHAPEAREWFTGSPEITFDAAFRNGTLQGAYLMIAARALGLDVGPMSGFDRAGVDREFLAPLGWRSNFLVNVGHGDAERLFPRLPRLDFDEACQIA
jgi:3-hydroxypropanoate dehydrogenase